MILLKKLRIGAKKQEASSMILSIIIIGLVLLCGLLMQRLHVIKIDNDWYSNIDTKRENLFLDAGRENIKLMRDYSNLIKRGYQLKVMTSKIFLRIRREASTRELFWLYDVADSGGGTIGWSPPSWNRTDMIIYLYENNYCVKRRKK